MKTEKYQQNGHTAIVEDEPNVPFIYDTKEFPLPESKEEFKKLAREEILEVFGLTKETMKPAARLGEIKSEIPILNLTGDFSLESIKPLPVRKASWQQIKPHQGSPLPSQKATSPAKSSVAQKDVLVN